MHDKTEFCGWKEREGATGECRASWKIFIALELKFNPPTNPLPLAKTFFSTFLRLSTLDTLYLFDTSADLMTEAAAALEGTLWGPRKGHGISLKAALPRQWVEIWREMWNCKEGRRRNAKEFAHCFHSPVLVCRLRRIRCVLNIKKNGNGYGCPASPAFRNWTFIFRLRLHFWAVLSRET